MTARTGYIHAKFGSHLVTLAEDGACGVESDFWQDYFSDVIELCHDFLDFSGSMYIYMCIYIYDYISCLCIYIYVYI